MNSAQINPSVLELVRRKVDDAAVDVGELFAKGHLIVSAQDAIPLSFRPLFDLGEGRVVAASPYAKYALADYEAVFRIIKAEGQTGFAAYQRCKTKIWRHNLDELMGGAKIERMNPQKVGSRTVLPCAFMGKTIPLTPEYSHLHFRNVLLHEIARAVPHDASAIVEVGCGTGELLCDLALRSEASALPMFGCDIARFGRKCLESFAGMLGLTNVQARALDVDAPNFDFVRSQRHVFC